MTEAPRSYPESPELRQDAATEREFLEDNIATVAFHLGQPGAQLSVAYGDGVKLLVDPGAVLQEISHRLSAPAQGSREAAIAECAAVARAMTIKLLNELATPPSIRGLSYYDNSHLEYGHKISDLIEANIRDLALPSTGREFPTDPNDQKYKTVGMGDDSDIGENPMTPAQDATALGDKWRAEAATHIAAALEEEDIGCDDWFLHREAARIYERCAKELATLRATSQTPDAGLKPILENLDGLDKQRTAGPWRKTHDNITSGDRSIAARLVARCDTDWGGGWKHDPTKGSKNARFIVALENAWPKIRAALSTPSASAGPQAEALMREAIRQAMEDRPGWYDTCREALAHPQQADGRGAVIDALKPILENLDGLDKQRTAGPWRKTHDNITSSDRSIEARLVARCDTGWGGGWKHDPTKGSKNARFIVALENAWPKIRAALQQSPATDGPAK